jgi:hypothetical protein
MIYRIIPCLLLLLLTFQVLAQDEEQDSMIVMSEADFVSLVMQHHPVAYRANIAT